ncbi:COG4223 family protein [Hansschlegelia zhihuaiae]|uniref:Phage tail protein n=1 Tax=Hansschlegelia zhihuaiae TaxID=405005 RepID=A0A4Q0MI48_9HYPH|nr:hypothetical protein [Hansschlegelia zhihuaiae]RXF73134.1 hypothetical protein EK403_11640 [Hansschlegelia zhihuaiae]
MPPSDAPAKSSDESASASGATRPAAAAAEAAKSGPPKGEAAPGPAKPEAAKAEPSKSPRGVSSMPSSTGKPAAAPSGPREGVGVLGVLAAAVGGAALAVLVIALFGKDLIRAQAPDMSRVAAAEAKLDTVGRDVAALRETLSKTAQATDASAIDARLTELSATIDQATQQADGRVAAVEKELRGLSEKVAQPAAADPALGVLAGRVDGIELRLQHAPTADALTVLGGRIAGLESRQAELPTKETIAGVASRVAAVGQAVEGVGQKIDAATAPLAQRVDQISAALSSRPKGDQAARLVVAIGALDQALAAGRPFAAELSAVKSAAGDNAELSALTSFAAAGIPTRQALAAELKDILDKLGNEKPPATASVFDRFVASASGVVKVAPQNAAAEPSASLRTRLPAAAEAGDVESALALRGSADETARAATDDWARRANARISAESALGAARTAALARLSAND